VSRGHPTDADREHATAETVAAAHAAARRGDGVALAQMLADHGVWLSADGRADGPADAVRFAEAAVMAQPDAHREWAEPQLRGAHSVLRYVERRGDASRAGALVLEARAGRLVLVIEAP
jgi:hypothetical protein